MCLELNKYLGIIVILLVVVAVETVYIILSQKGVFSGENVSGVNFDEPQSGKDVYNDLKALGCKIYNVTEGYIPGYGTSGYTLIFSYNAFYELAKGESVVLWQQLGFARAHSPQLPDIA